MFLESDVKNHLKTIWIQLILFHLHLDVLNLFIVYLYQDKEKIIQSQPWSDVGGFSLFSPPRLNRNFRARERVVILSVGVNSLYLHLRMMYNTPCYQSSQ